MIYLGAFLVYLLRVYARAAQQYNVIHFKWMHVPVYSYGMTMIDVYLWGYAGYLGASGQWLAMALYGAMLGTAGTLGTWLAMYQHKRWCDIHDIERVGL